MKEGKKLKSNKSKNQPKKFLNFIKPSWLKGLFFGIYFVPLIYISALINSVFYYFIVILVRIMGSNPNLIDYGFLGFLLLVLIPILIHVIIVYLTACFIVSIYKKKNSKRFFKIMLWIGIVALIIIILFVGFIVLTRNYLTR